MPFFIMKISKEIEDLFQRLEPEYEKYLTNEIKDEHDLLFPKHRVDEIEVKFKERFPKLIFELYPEAFGELMTTCQLKLSFVIRHLKKSLESLRRCMKNRRRSIGTCREQFKSTINRIVKLLCTYDRVGQALLVVSYRLDFLTYLTDLLCILWRILADPETSSRRRGAFRNDTKMLAGILRGVRYVNEPKALWINNWYRVVPAMVDIGEEDAVDGEYEIPGHGIRQPSFPWVPHWQPPPFDGIVQIDFQNEIHPSPLGNDMFRFLQESDMQKKIANMRQQAHVRAAIRDVTDLVEEDAPGEHERRVMAPSQIISRAHVALRPHALAAPRAQVAPRPRYTPPARIFPHSTSTVVAKVPRFKRHKLLRMPVPNTVPAARRAMLLERSQRSVAPSPATLASTPVASNTSHCPSSASTGPFLTPRVPSPPPCPSPAPIPDAPPSMALVTMADIAMMGVYDRDREFEMDSVMTEDLRDIFFQSGNPSMAYTS